MPQVEIWKNQRGYGREKIREDFLNGFSFPCANTDCNLNEEPSPATKTKEMNRAQW